MQIEIIIHDLSSVNLANKEYDVELDNISSILFDVCDAISGSASFRVAGFGDARWQVDVAVDLPVILAQLPEFSRGLNSLGELELDFYEQGVERKLVFTHFSNGYIAKCQSYGGDATDFVAENLSVQELKKIVCQLRDQFMCALSVVNSNLVGHRWVRDWCNAIECAK